MSDHVLCELEEGDSYVARCSCGWVSTRALSRQHAGRRFSIHARQKRAMEVCEQAWMVAEASRVRVLDLQRMQHVARNRRATLVTHRLELRRALQRAGRPSPADGFSLERMLDIAREMAGLTVPDLWVDYFAYGGTRTEQGLRQVLSGDTQITRDDYYVLSTVLNERFRDSGFGNPLPLDWM